MDHPDDHEPSPSRQEPPPTTFVRVLRRPEVRWLIGLAACALGIVLFIHLASEMQEGETLSVDRAILLAMRQPHDLATPIGPHWLAQAMAEITALGSPTILTLVSALVCLYLCVSRRFAMAVFVVAAIGGGALLSALLKGVFLRQRPNVVPHLVDVSTLSFPSGHAMNSAIVYLTLGILLAQVEGRRSVRTFLILTALTLSFIIGISRLFLGVHWPSDVAAGWCVGSTWALTCVCAFELLKRRLKTDATIEATLASRSATLNG